MTDLDLIMAGAMVTFLSAAGAYAAMRHRADESPVDSYDSPRKHQPAPLSPPSKGVETR